MKYRSSGQPEADDRAFLRVLRGSSTQTRVNPHDPPNPWSILLSYWRPRLACGLLQKLDDVLQAIANNSLQRYNPRRRKSIYSCSVLTKGISHVHCTS
jgi:hypothetical protein